MAAEEADRQDQTAVARILVVASGLGYADYIDRFLTEQGFEVVIAKNISEGFERLEEWAPDAVLLEVLPRDRSAMDACRQIVALTNVPVLLLGTSEDELEVVLGLELGAADYFSKPYRFRELEARLRAVLRRSGTKPSPRDGSRARTRNVSVAFGPVELDFEGHRLFVEGKLVHLSRREFDLLSTLASPPGVVRTREELIDRVWSGVDLADTRTLDKHIRRLRDKIERDPRHPEFLVTVHSVGYCLHDDLMGGSGP